MRFDYVVYNIVGKQRSKLVTLDEDCLSLVSFCFGINYCLSLAQRRPIEKIHFFRVPAQTFTERSREGRRNLVETGRKTKD